MGVTVPAEYQADVNQAAAASGLPVAVVAAQIYTESSFNPNAVSPAGAEGIAQFLPSTFASYGTGSPFNVQDAFAAYAKFMGDLLHQFNGNVTDALAAYNAGPGDIGAGMGYAQQILSLAGSPGGITVTPGSGGSGGSGSNAATGTDTSWWSILFPWLGSDPISGLLGNNGLAGVLGSGIEQGLMRGFLDILIQLWNKIAKPVFWVFEVLGGIVIMNVSLEIMLANTAVGRKAAEVASMAPGPLGMVARGAQFAMGGKVTAKKSSAAVSAPKAPSLTTKARPLPARGADRGITRSAPRKAINPAPENEPRSAASPSQKRYRAAANKVNSEGQPKAIPARKAARRPPRPKMPSVTL